MTYHQPDFFRFGSDSLMLVEEIRKNYKNQSRALIDLGTGCGVLAIELAQTYQFESIHLVEYQREAFELSLQKNLAAFQLNNSVIHWLSISEFNKNGAIQSELIVFNPPYFKTESSRSSCDQQRNIAHRLVIDLWEDWISCVERSLAINGEAYWLEKKPFLSSSSKKIECLLDRGDLRVMRLRRLNVE
jgi:tRNA1(Val) A37 N6-methylase TrmN6